MALPARWIEQIQNATIVPFIDRHADELLNYPRHDYPGKSDHLLLDQPVMDFVDEHLADDWLGYCLTTRQLLVEYPGRHMEVFNLPEALTSPPIPTYMAGSTWDDDQPKSRLCFQSDAFRYIIELVANCSHFLNSA